MPNERSAPQNGSHDGAGTSHGVIVTKRSGWSMAETVDRLAAVVAARDLRVFAVVDHAAEARRVGIDLRQTKLFIVGSAVVSAPLIAAAPLAALDLPLRMVVWEDGYRTNVSYPSPADVARRYGLDGELAAALESIDAVASAVVNR